MRRPLARRRAAVALVVVLMGLPAAWTRASAAGRPCAADSRRVVSGTVAGFDDRDVNVSVGIDVVDRNYRALNADPAAADYGCAKNDRHGGYAVPQHELNHYVDENGVPKASLQLQSLQQTTRTWGIDHLPANAAYVWVEVYSRGYVPSNCRTNTGAPCFNHTSTAKYGFANRQWVPVGTQDLAVRLPGTCEAGGTAGDISGEVRDGAGRPVGIEAIWAWSGSRWNQGTPLQGWGSGRVSPDGRHYRLSTMASGQAYTVWVFLADGRALHQSGVRVRPCRTTPVTFTVTSTSGEAGPPHGSRGSLDNRSRATTPPLGLLLGRRGSATP